MTKRAQQARDYAWERIADCLHPPERHWLIFTPMRHDPEVLRVAEEQTQTDRWWLRGRPWHFVGGYFVPRPLPPRDG